MNFKRYIAFTLAEVLITLLIIGVIASIVIPGLIADSQNAELKAAWKKSYADVSQAAKRVLQDTGGSFSQICSNTDDNVCFRNYFAQYLNYVKTCSAATSDGCLAANAKLLNGTTGNAPTALGWSVNVAAFILNDGSSIVFNHDYKDCMNALCGSIYIDVNGPNKGPNVWGKDMFMIAVLYNKIIPFGSNGYGTVPSVSCVAGSVDSNNNGNGCSALYLYQ